MTRKTYTPTYRAEYRDQNGWHATSWETKKRPGVRVPHGSPNDRNAETLRVSLNRAFQPNGVNGHLAEALGYIPHVSELRVIRQKDGKVVAKTVAPMFEAV